jgi:hypothetical protein
MMLLTQGDIAQGELNSPEHIEVPPVSNTRNGVMTVAQKLAVDGLTKGVQRAEISILEQGGTAIVQPNVRTYIALGDGISSAVVQLDDTAASADYAQEFMFVISGLTGDDPPQIQIAYQSGAGVDLPENLVWETGYVYELNVLDGLAVSTRWEAVA